MSASYVMEKYQPPKNQAPSKVRRFPLYRRPDPKPAPTAPAATEPPKEEKPAPPPPEWSNWQFIKEPLWEGYWRASPLEDGGWHYQLTKDGKTIWEQKVPKPEAPKPEEPKVSQASVKTEGTVRLPPPSALKKTQPPTTPATGGQPSVKTVVSETTAPKTEKASTTTTITTTETIPSYTVRKPEDPKPPAPPRKVTGTITLHTKSGKAVTVPLPDPGKPVVIRTLLEN
ncbi:hypothetical protein N0V82_006412 [Gnomoniopsis sp. IMI 355080]|nr:hypothetical protein N0V82_006412 [Gnomoniopsis sp. IMI 355080]